MCHAAVRVNSISIHSLRIEGDAVQNAVVGFPHSFQSTPSVWRETLCRFPAVSAVIISIHSLRMEGDSTNLRKYKIIFAFQSTHSVWRETYLSKT